MELYCFNTMRLVTLNIAKNKILEITIKIGNFHCQWYPFEKKRENLFENFDIIKYFHFYIARANEE